MSQSGAMRLSANRKRVKVGSGISEPLLTVVAALITSPFGGFILA